MKALFCHSTHLSVYLGALLFCVPSINAPAKTNYLEMPASDVSLLVDGPIRRYDWFKKLWKEKRTGCSKRIKQDQEGLVFFGNSITQGWGDDFKGHFQGVKAINRGIGGDTTRGMLVRLLGDVLVLNPTGMVQLMGTNDLEEGASPEVVAVNVKLILNQLIGHDKDMPVILCTVFPSSSEAKRPSLKIKKLNRLLSAAGKGKESVTVLDTWTLFAGPATDLDAKKEELPDFLHSNDLGYAKWRKALWPLLATHEYVDNEPDTEEGFVSLFNSKDLSDWGFRDLKTLEASEAFGGEANTSDGRFIVKNGRLVVTTPTEGRKTAQLWTTHEFAKDFVLRLEFRATRNADCGIFLRRPQLQCRDYSLAGPLKDLKNYKPQEWNTMEVMVANGIAHAACNDEPLGEPIRVPKLGPIGLEGDRGLMEYRRIRIKQ